MNKLLERQAYIETSLAQGHLEYGTLVLYDVSSTYLEGETCPLAQYGYSRERKKSKLQIVFGLVCNAQGIPVAVEVFEGNTKLPNHQSFPNRKSASSFWRQAGSICE